MCPPCGCEGSEGHVLYRVSSVRLRRLFGHGQDGPVHRGQHVSIFHPQSPGQQGQGHRPGGCGGVSGAGGGKRIRYAGGPRAVYHQSLLQGRAHPGVCPHDACGRPEADGAPAGERVQLPSRQPHRAGYGDGYCPDRGDAERHPYAGPPHHRPAGDHVRQGQ